MRCPFCQSEILPDAVLCNACGTSLDADVTRRFETPRSPQTRPISFDSIDDARFVAGTILAERYRIVGLLGKGGMGEVYRADDLKLSQPVALKFLPDRFLSDGAALARFHREVRVARQVSHRNVCRVYDIGEINGHHFLSMEYIKGEELSSLLRRIGRLPSDKALQIARQICAGLAAAHDSGILHRDLKPSNVMIDGDGNARITDFGLAGLAEEFHDEELTSGTPAYMAPEQLDGKAVTPRSDIYSLGLVLYELFTGKRAYEASTLIELIRLRRSDTSPTTPTSLVKDLDPLIERVIDRCLQKDPAQRPSSALQVAAALPGGDPIAAALAAGETPSPEMVAAAPKTGTLRPTVAIGLLASSIVLILLSMWLTKYVSVHRMIPLPKSPEVLKENAVQMIRSFGYSSTAADVVYGFNYDPEYAQNLRSRPFNSDRQTLGEASPIVVHFWYRQSPTALVPYNTQFVDMLDPPNEVPGMLKMKTDTNGNLYYLDVAPAQIEPAAKGKPTDSNRSDQLAEVLFRAAGLDIARFQPAPSQWTPPRAYDARKSWTGTHPTLPDVPLRVEAAFNNDAPVYFEVVTPWTKPAFQTFTPTTGQKLGTWVLLGVFFVTMLGAALLALKNLRMGRGDRRGAFRLALFLFLLRMIFWLFSTHHVAETRELMLLVTGLQSALFWATFAGVLYLALEPYLRRRWPHRIISWSRLLAGDLRDPLIGRDILVGTLVGSLAIALMYARIAVPKMLGLRSGMPDLIEAFGTSMAGIDTFLFLFINQITASVVQAFMVVFLLLFLSLLFRRDWLGVGIGFLIIEFLFVSSAIGADSPVGLIMLAAVIGLFVLCAVRWGVIAFITCLTFFHLWIFFPLTTEVTSWYANIFILDTLALLAIAVYGFVISVGGQSLFSGTLLRED